ncbi:farnesyltranstransferase [Elstera litoralis]|uniref:Octaprenyl diphosphate synthase n=1 Tax=Elstera litoralis TaxID=552518 RepID=A0A0F3ISZ0_9PROT|nr:polyprenyl synthetase family protein [Elstera litoralis]KJV09663.1 farnesyltranstransferase [Elstera litoralis]
MTRPLPSPDTAPAAPSLDRLVALVATDMAAVNQIILDRMQSPVALIPQLASHLIAAGGKRLRPLITLAAAQLCGYQGTRHQKLAACVEFIHTATLLHDDVVDDSLLRRGAASANAIFGNKSSVLVGDFLFSRAFQLMVEDGSLRVLAVLSEASAVIAEGEVHQLLTTGDLATTEAQYLEVIGAKTAVLFAAAAEVGAVVADRPEDEIQALRRFGTNLGVAFQLIDDALDYAASEAALGKTVGDDFREGKVTLPVILAYARGNAEERAFWHRTIEDLDQTDADLANAQALIEKYGTVRETVARARTVGDAAKAELARFPDIAIRSSLMEAIDFAVSRGY